MKPILKSGLTLYTITLILWGCADSSTNSESIKSDSSSVQNYVPIELEADDLNSTEDEYNFNKADSVQSSFFEDDCSAVLNPIYNTYRVQSDKELIIKLQEIYSLDETRYKQASGGTSGGGSGGYFPYWGSAEYSQNKTNIDKLYRKIRQTNSSEFSLDEHKELTIASANPEVAIAMYDAYSSCKNSRNRLRLVYNDSTKVVFELYLRPIPYDRKTKFKSAIGGNLVLDASSDIKVGRNVRYGTGYTLVFNRKNKAAGSITINIENEEPVTKKFDAAFADPVIVPGWCSADEMDKPYFVYATASFDYKKKKYTITNMDGTTQTLAWNRKVPVNALIKTNYNSDSIRIVSVHASYNKHIRSVTHSLRAYPGSKNIDIATVISPTSKPATVTFTIHYQKYCTRCIANCD